MSAPAVSDPGSIGESLALHRMPGHHIRRLQQVAVSLFGQELATIDITPVQYAALATLAAAGPLVQSELAGLIGYDRATIGGVIDRLEAKGWAARSHDPADRRVRRLDLTEAGRATLALANPRVENAQQRLLTPLAATERQEFERLCRKILVHHLG